MKEFILQQQERGISGDSDNRQENLGITDFENHGAMDYKNNQVTEQFKSTNKNSGNHQ